MPCAKLAQLRLFVHSPPTPRRTYDATAPQDSFARRLRGASEKRSFRASASVFCLFVMGHPTPKETQLTKHCAATAEQPRNFTTSGSHRGLQFRICKTCLATIIATFTSKLHCHLEFSFGVQDCINLLNCTQCHDVVQCKSE